jgi:hypothetical protein
MILVESPEVKQYRDFINSKETGFFTKFGGCNEVFSKKPGFWTPIVSLTVLDAAQPNFVILRVAKNLKHQEKGRDCVSPIKFDRTYAVSTLLLGYEILRLTQNDRITFWMRKSSLSYLTN